MTFEANTITNPAGIWKAKSYVDLAWPLLMPFGVVIFIFGKFYFHMKTYIDIGNSKFKEWAVVKGIRVPRENIPEVLTKYSIMWQVVDAPDANDDVWSLLLIRTYIISNGSLKISTK